MPLPRQPLEAIPCLLAMRTFISASRPMAKTVVSAVKPGGQAMRPCPSGFLLFVLRPWDPLHKSLRRVHLRSRAVCGVANTRNSYGYCCVNFSSSAPCSPSRSAAHTWPARFVQRIPWALGIGHWRLYIDNGGCPWWGDCSPAVGRGSHRGVQPVGCLSKPCARSPVEGWCGARKGARSEPGENSPFVAPARMQCACRGRSSFGNAPGGAFVIHWIHVSIFFPQQNVRRT